MIYKYEIKMLNFCIFAIYKCTFLVLNEGILNSFQN